MQFISGWLPRVHQIQSKESESKNDSSNGEQLHISFKYLKNDLYLLKISWYKEEIICVSKT